MNKIALSLFTLITFVMACAPHRHTAKLYDGKLETQIKSEDFTLGNFNVNVKVGSEKSFQLSVHHQKNPNKTLWSTIPGETFLAAGKGKEEIHEKKGSFFVREDEIDVCEEQTVTSAQMQSNKLVIEGKLTCDSDKVLSYSFGLSAISANKLNFATSISEPTYNRTYLIYQSEENEGFYGFGEQFTYFDQKGKQLPIFVGEQGVGRGEEIISTAVDIAAKSAGTWYTSYAPVPHYVSSKLNSLYLTNNEHSFFDMREDDRVQISLFGNKMQGRIIYGETPLELIEEYTTYSGRMPELPDWIHNGAILGMQGGTESVLKRYNAMKAANGPVAALWLQDWVGQRKTSFGKQLFWNWELDNDRYPGWDKMVSDLKKEDVRVMTYINPFFANLTKEDKPNIRRNMYEELKEKGFLVKKPDGAPYLIENTSFSAGLIDLSNPAARKWVKEVIKKELIATGASGWMADFGEALPYDSVLHNADPVQYHNAYPEEWQKVNMEAVKEAGKDGEIVFFARSGYTRSPGTTTLFWLGDQLVTWSKYDGIKTAVTGLVSGGISGYSLNHSDIGGYTTIPVPWFIPVSHYYRSKELELRWIELNAFTPIYRTHEGNRPENNHQFNDDQETLLHFARFANVYKAWKFYRVKLVKEAAQKGHPVIRHPWIHFPNDSEFKKMSYEQFMVGDELMVIPVLDEDEDTVEVYLPAGSWINLFTQELVKLDKPTRFEVKAPIGTPVVFYPAGSQVGKQFHQNLIKLKVL